MKLKLGKKEVECKLSTMAVENIEEKFDCAIHDLFTEGRSLKAKEVNFILFSCAKTDLPLDEFKQALSENYSYVECIGLVTELLKDPNAPLAEIGTEQAL
jgi:hypothetical protein